MLFDLENLDCDGCANSVRHVLLHQPGVLAVRVEVIPAQVNLSCEDDVDRAHVLSLLEHLGYPPVGRNSMLHKARAKLSCEMGRIRHRAYYHPMMSEG